MKRFSTFSLVLLAGSGVVLAKDQPPAGWRRVGDPPPVQGPPPALQGQDPTQPVDRSDAYGQPQQPQADRAAQEVQRPEAQQNNRPPAAARTSPGYGPPPPYGLPPELTIRPGTFITVRTNQPLSSDRNQEGDVF